MTAPEFLDVSDIVEIHRRQLEEFGGRDGLRDPGPLESALAQPMARFAGRFLHEVLFADRYFCIRQGHGNESTVLTEPKPRMLFSDNMKSA